MRAEIRVDDAEVRRALQAMARRVRDTTPAMAAVARALKAQVDLGFRGGRDPYGTPWAPLRSREGQPLRKTGRLQRSIRARHSRDEAVVGTNLAYARVHQFGAVIRPRRAKVLRFRVGKQWVSKRQVTIPARPFLPDPERGLPEAWRRKVLAVVERHVMGGEA